jgi:hypothetical protein
MGQVIDTDEDGRHQKEKKKILPLVDHEEFLG